MNDDRSDPYAPQEKRDKTNKGNWFKEMYSFVWYIQVAVVVVLIVLWVLAGMPK